MIKAISGVANILFWCIIFISTIKTSIAMTFSVGMLHNEPLIIGDGRIVSGDVDRLRSVLIEMNMHSSGYYPLVLNSSGGSVDAAFELSRLIDENPVNTYVAFGAYCVSACAAIVFIAGKEHVALPGSHLGFHGCYDLDTKNINNLCNEMIATHAFEHGTAYGSIMAFIGDVPHDKILWMDGTDADCWAINRYQISPAPDGYEKCVFDLFINQIKN